MKRANRGYSGARRREDAAVSEAFRHPALFYRGIDEYLTGTLSFIEEGLAADEPVAVAVPGDRLEPLRAGLNGSASRVRLIGEPIWPGRTEVEAPACVQHEALINQAFAGRSVEILCPYDADALPGDVLADAERTHPTVIGATGRRHSSRYAPDQVLAEYNR